MNQPLTGQPRLDHSPIAIQDGNIPDAMDELCSWKSLVLRILDCALCSAKPAPSQGGRALALVGHAPCCSDVHMVPIASPTERGIMVERPLANMLRHSLLMFFPSTSSFMFFYRVSSHSFLLSRLCSLVCALSLCALVPAHSHSSQQRLLSAAYLVP